MFSGLVGFIKPLLKKNTLGTKQISKVRPIEEDNFSDHLDSHDDIEDQVTLGEDVPDQDVSQTFDRNDEMKISIEGIKHMINETITNEGDKTTLFAILDRLKKKGVTTLPFDTTSPLIDQIKSYEG